MFCAGRRMVDVAAPALVTKNAKYSQELKTTGQVRRYGINGRTVTLMRGTTRAAHAHATIWLLASTARRAVAGAWRRPTYKSCHVA